MGQRLRNTVYNAKVIDQCVYFYSVFFSVTNNIIIGDLLICDI